jgi:putative ABC transport system permease protein
MEVLENIKEGVKSIKANVLRTTLTAAIIAIGITSLVGILTAIDAMQASLNDSFSNLGANTFDVQRKRTDRSVVDGKKAKVFPPLKYAELNEFKEKYNGPGVVSLNVSITGNAELKYKSKFLPSFTSYPSTSNRFSSPART